MASSFTWQQLLDFVRRQGAASVQVSQADGILLCRMVSARMYTFAPWQFVLTTTSLGQVPCIDGVQDYAMPSDCYRLVKAWMYTNGYSTSTGGVAQTHELDVVRNLAVDLNPVGWMNVYAIAQLGNSGLWRLNQATAVPTNFPYEIQAQYQPSVPQITDLGMSPWFPDEYLEMAQAGILYYLYQANNDPRAGTTSVGPGGQTEYSGQLGTWMGAMERSAAAERMGAIDVFYPTQMLGADSSTWGGGWW